MSKAEQLIRQWSDESLNEINQRLQTLEKRLYCSYEPSLLPKPDFWSRLDSWLESLPASEADSKKLLFRLAVELFFVGPTEFLALYQCAYNGPIARWIIDKAGIDICAPNAKELLNKAVEKTWFCPISDSMKINTFYHVNNVPSGFDFRPDWRSLSEFGSKALIKDYCQSQGIERLVLLEDFVGGGSQMKAAVEYAASFRAYLNTLVVPLIICPNGVNTAMALEAKYGSSLQFSSIISIPTTNFLSLNPINDEPELHDEIRKLAERIYPLVSDGKAVGKEKPYHWLGFPASNPTGGLVVMHTNTPDNSLPLIHWPAPQWSPLFPRHSRL